MDRIKPNSCEIGIVYCCIVSETVFDVFVKISDLRLSETKEANAVESFSPI